MIVRLLRSFIWALVFGMVASASLAPVGPLQAKSINSKGSRSVGGGGGGLSDVPLPGGSSGFTAQNWLQVSGADGYVVYCATSSQTYPDSSLYPYQYVVSSGATLTKVVTGIASGTYYVMTPAVVDSIEGPGQVRAYTVT